MSPLFWTGGSCGFGSCWLGSCWSGSFWFGRCEDFRWERTRGRLPAEGTRRDEKGREGRLGLVAIGSLKATRTPISMKKQAHGIQRVIINVETVTSGTKLLPGAGGAGIKPAITV